MKKLNELNRRDLEQLSAYLDGELSAKEITRFEARLKVEPQLVKALDELKLTSYLLSSLPKVRPPRNFMLSPEMVGIRKRTSLYPVFRFATVVAAVAFAVLVGADTFFLSRMGIMSDALLATAPEIMLEQESVRTVGDAEAPAEAQVEMPMAVEPLIALTEEVMEEIIVEGETDSFMPEAPSGTGIDETQEYALEKANDTEDQPMNAMTTTPEETLLAAEEPAGGGIAVTLEAPIPSVTLVPTPLPAPTEIPRIEVSNEQPGLSLEPIHAVEAGLGFVALLLAGITIYLHKQR